MVSITSVSINQTVSTATSKTRISDASDDTSTPATSSTGVSADTSKVAAGGRRWRGSGRRQQFRQQR
jgi:cytoskeletal protein RodZ